MVLWRKACIPRIAHNRHPSAVQISKFFSEILRFCVVALYLSIHRMMNVMTLISKRYRIIIFIRDMIERGKGNKGLKGAKGKGKFKI